MIRNTNMNTMTSIIQRALNTPLLPKSGFRFLLFILYNLLYVAYMLGYASQALYMATLLLFCAANGIIFVYRGTAKIRGFQYAGYILFIIVVFGAISIPIQIMHDGLRGFLFSALGRLGLPIINALLFANSVDEEDWNYYFNILLVRFCCHFLFMNADNLSLTSILSINWSHSEAATESSLAHDFLIMEMLFLAMKQKGKAFICLLFCMLSMKRLSFILAPVAFVLSSRVPKGDVKRVYRVLVMVAIVLSPFVLMWLYRYDVMGWLYSSFGIDLNAEMTGRPTIYHLAISGMSGDFNGYGSINNYLAGYASSHFGTVWNGILHNDTIGIYLETGILGIASFAFCIVEFSKKNYWHFFMMLYLVFVAITSHILDYFSVWVTFYLAVICTNVSQERAIDSSETVDIPEGAGNRKPSLSKR